MHPLPCNLSQMQKETIYTTQELPSTILSVLTGGNHGQAKVNILSSDF
jgi:hypothetical protein